MAVSYTTKLYNLLFPGRRPDFLKFLLDYVFCNSFHCNFGRSETKENDFQDACFPKFSPAAH